ncbi:MAG: hypothetical protein HY902_00870 [Deltaproteobacteria bacterium]|nr:hypothetical protein [Deltaproteobacteria bacterium]
MKKHPWLGAVALVLAVATLGCASEPTADSSGAACNGWAAQTCGALQKCAPYTLTSTWGTLANCTTRRAAVCLAKLQAPGTAASASSVNACAAAVAAVACSDIQLLDSLAACLPKAGSLDVAAACADDSQCASTRCRITGGSPGQACGTCVVRAPLGGACASDADCQGSAKCEATQSIKVCKERVAIGEKCDDSHVCIAPATCQSNKCTAPAAVGSKCDLGTKNCDSGAGAYCHDQKELCTAFKSAGEGKSCNFINGEFVKCDYGLACGDLQAGVGTCHLVPDFGEACSTGDNPPCRAGLVCDAGLCSVPKFTSCK